MIEPRTEAGRRLVADVAARRWGPETTLERVLAIEAEAAAGPRDEGLAKGKPAIHKPDPTNVATWTMFEAAAGPCHCPCESRGKQVLIDPTCPVHGAEAAAGPRDEGLDVERLARAIDAVLPLGVYREQAERIAREYGALAKASE